MADRTTVTIPLYSAERLRALAALQETTATSILAEMIDEACATAGLDVKSDAVTVQPYFGRSFIVDLFGGAYRVELPRSGVQSLADDLRRVADKSGSAWNIDHDYRVSRQGSAVKLAMRVIERKEGQSGNREIDLEKTMSPDVAREIAKGLLAGLPVEVAA